MGGTSGVKCTAADFTNPATECYALDTNHDGVVDLSDDPFTPFYPTNAGKACTNHEPYRFGALQLAAGRHQRRSSSAITVARSA